MVSFSALFFISLLSLGYFLFFCTILHHDLIFISQRRKSSCVMADLLIWFHFLLFCFALPFIVLLWSLCLCSTSLLSFVFYMFFFLFARKRIHVLRTGWDKIMYLNTTFFVPAIGYEKFSRRILHCVHVFLNSICYRTNPICMYSLSLGFWYLLCMLMTIVPFFAVWYERRVFCQLNEKLFKEDH